MYMYRYMYIDSTLYSSPPKWKSWTPGNDVLCIYIINPAEVGKNLGFSKTPPFNFSGMTVVSDGHIEMYRPSTITFHGSIWESVGAYLSFSLSLYIPSGYLT